MTQPIRIEDAVMVENESGRVEEITSTYVVLRLWDMRRMIVPLTYFIEKPFQNWTRESSTLIGTVLLHVDFTTPVERVREKAVEIVKASPLWDGNLAKLQVTDTTNSVMQLRILASARSSGDAFDLRCEIREKMIDFLQREIPNALPRSRQETVASAGRTGDAGKRTLRRPRLKPHCEGQIPCPMLRATIRGAVAMRRRGGTPTMIRTLTSLAALALVCGALRRDRLTRRPIRPRP